MPSTDEIEDIATAPNQGDPESQGRIRDEEEEEGDGADAARDDGTSSTSTSKNKQPAKDPEPLSGQHIWNLVFCLLAWGFTVANVTLGKK